MKFLSKVSAASLLLLSALHLQGCGSGVVQAAAASSAAITIGLASQAGSATAQQPTAALQVAANAGAPVNLAFQASGGQAPYTWSVASGSLPAGLSLNQGGLLTGVASTSGSWDALVAVHDSISAASPVTRPVHFAVAAQSASAASLAITTSELASGHTGAPYSATLQAKGGTPAYVWFAPPTTLPDGLSLSPAGVLSGTPTSAGTFQFALSVADHSSPTQLQSKQFSLTIANAAAPLTISTASLAAASTGAAYSVNLQATGGTPAYQWSLASGSLPQGITLTANGLLSGTPVKTGTSAFAVTVADKSTPANRQTKSLSLTVAPAPLVIKANPLADGKVGAAYAATLQADGGTPRYTWSVASGSLPAGLSLSANGALSGTPRTAGVSRFVIALIDSSSPAQRQTAQMSLTVAPAATPLAITTSTLAATASGASYTVTLQATGGTPKYTWTVASGALPLGLSLSSDGVLSGAAKLPGTYPFTLTVSDAGQPVQRQTRAFSLVVRNSPLTITTTSLPAAQLGTIYSTGIFAAGGTPRYTWALASGSLPDGLTMDELTGVVYGTPSKSGTFSFTIAISDRSTPVQTQSRTFNLVVRGAGTPLAISTSGLISGSVGKNYSAALSATGGTPAYTWSITSGTLPAGLSLAASTGVISGTPTTAGSSTFTVSVKDSTATQTQSATASINVEAAGMTTWYVRPDGGTRYSVRVPNGQCDGQSDAPYPGKGVNQHCAYQDFRYLWDDKSGSVGAGAWVIAGGDTVLIRGCTAGPNQSNASNPNCRIGWDAPTGTGDNLWCYGVGSYTCTNPPIPAGTAARHTRILGQNYANCATNGSTNPREYVRNLTQIFAGFSLQYSFNLRDTQYVDVQCIELTTHNGVCVTSGSPQYPRPCNRNQPLDDYALNGFTLDNKSANILFQDVYVHGFNSSGFDGPIGGAITMTRVYSGFNAFAGWNFDDGSDTPDAPGSSITAKYVTMIGNGCYEEYPVSHDFPAKSCYDDLSNGFGDAWSGQDTDLDGFLCDHCVMAYNTKDAFIGPHTNVKTLVITNSQSYANMGAQWKWNNTPNASTYFANNLTIGNCIRMSVPIPGAPQNYDLRSGRDGSYLSDYCRAAGNTVAINSQQNSSVSFYNNTFVDYIDTVFLLGCGPSNNNANKMCGSTTWLFQNNVFLGYHLQGQDAPGLFYLSDPTVAVTQKNNVQFGNRSGHGEVCNANGNVCADPALINEPAQKDWTDQTFLDNFNFHPAPSSPAVDAGATYNGMLSTDVYGVLRSTAPSLGAVEP